MKIVLFGATGMIGQRILHEAVGRGHSVTAIARDPSKITETGPDVSPVAGDVLDTKAVAEQVKGADAVVSSVSPGAGANDIYEKAAKSLIEGLKSAGVKRLIFVGGAGSLEVAPGVQLVDTPGFPEIYKARALAMRDELNYVRANGGDLDWTYISPSAIWTYISPAAIIHPGERTGTFRIGGDQLLVDAEGNSYISAEDFAIGLVDEIESSAHLKQRITLGY
jgi:putative NADH-flavin reductase